MIRIKLRHLRSAKDRRRDFGSRVIRFVVASEKDSSVDIDYETDGLRCRIAFTKASEGPPVDVAAR
ncbi:MAG: hypothetical protein HY243_04260 [Proteobacteria bacterium]|nr:hypothetical protein [Pseudomonadota bacterium]